RVVGGGVVEERRQRELLTQRLGRLVSRESGPVSRELEEDAAGLAEVDRAEVVAVDDRRRVRLGRRQQALAPRVLLAEADTPRDVMHRAGALQRARVRG